MILSGLAASVQLNPTIGVFVKPISDEFGWSRGKIGVSRDLIIGRVELRLREHAFFKGEL